MQALYMTSRRAMGGWELAGLAIGCSHGGCNIE